jgi:hypothetical protein
VAGCLDVSNAGTCALSAVKKELSMNTYLALTRPVKTSFKDCDPKNLGLISTKGKPPWPVI